MIGAPASLVDNPQRHPANTTVSVCTAKVELTDALLLLPPMRRNPSVSNAASL
jgi:hypothetical protein